jgi:hypothetical protein
MFSRVHRCSAPWLYSRGIIPFGGCSRSHGPILEWGVWGQMGRGRMLC